MISGKRYIAVEGPIGVGKTSLAERLAERLGGRALLEEPEKNPFLPAFYRSMRRHALATQLQFLFDRLKQVAELRNRELGGDLTVADFLLDKDPLFAQLTLEDREYELYRRIFDYLGIQAPVPDLVIYLQAPAEQLLERVQRRGLKMERKIGEDYLKRVADAYTQFFYRYDAAPLMIVNSSNLNFVDSQRDFDLLVEQLGRMRGPREFFNRAA